MPPLHFAAPRGAALGLLLAALQAAAADPSPALTMSPAQIQASGIRTEKAQAGASAEADLSLQGTVQLPSQASDLVSAPVAGVVQAVLVSPGQAVKAGEAVAQLLSPQLIEWQRDWLHADTQAQLAGERLRRDEQLFAEGIIAEQRLQESRAQQRMAQWALDERRQALQLAGVSAAQLRQRGLDANLTLRAAASGTVLAIDATPGQRLDAGMPVARLARSGRLSIELQASREQLALLHVGDPLRVEGCKTPARLSAITPEVSSATQAALLRAEFNGPENCLRLNQFVRLQAVARAPRQGRGQDAALTLPAEALVQHEGQPHVFVRSATGFVPTPVTLAPGGNRRITVLGGLRPGDEVVVQGTAALKGLWQGLGSDGERAGKGE